VSLLPPHVPHNGSPATPGGFRKRVLYLDLSRLDESLIGPAVDTPDLSDPVLRHRVGQLHSALARPGDELEGESRLALITERLRDHLRPPPCADAGVPQPAAGRGVAHRLRELLDERVTEGLGLDEAARLLHAHPTHLVRAFGKAFGIAPHQYLTARRVERARRLLLDGRPAAEVAPAAGFHDQSHLTRHFRRHLGVTPGRYGRGCGGRFPAAPAFRAVHPAVPD
jgi:AraC-like DNA-binding protein